MATNALTVNVLDALCETGKYEDKSNITRAMGNSMDKILPGLYVGNIRGATNKNLLDSNQITHILSIFDRAQPVIDNRIYLCIKANDVAAQDLTQYFSQCSDFIHNARINKGTVLVHCVAGMSRSVTVTTAYIMTITNLGWREALNAVRGARKCANPNFGFQRQLLAFYHDHLPKEKERFQASFPASPFGDQEECERLIEAHRKWVLHGDEGEKDDSETTYPLQHNAYRGSCRAGSGKPSSGDLTGNETSAIEVVPMTCSQCSCVLQQQPVASEDGMECGEVLCEKCSQIEHDTLNLVRTAPDVAHFEVPSAAESDALQACAPGCSTQNEDQMETDSSDELVDTLFAENSRKKGREVCFNENIQISKVEKIDSKMVQNFAISSANKENNTACGLDIEVMTSNLKLERNAENAGMQPEVLVDDMFSSGTKPRSHKL